jgi:hypothetical protein
MSRVDPLSTGLREVKTNLEGVKTKLEQVPETVPLAKEVISTLKSLGAKLESTKISPNSLKKVWVTIGEEWYGGESDVQVFKSKKDAEAFAQMCPFNTLVVERHLETAFPSTHIARNRIRRCLDLLGGLEK